MTNLNNALEEILAGSVLFGTGGGGRPSEARSILVELSRRNAMPEVVAIDTFKRSALIVSAFTVGSVAAAGNASAPILRAAENLTSRLERGIDAIVPVEIGPLALATAFLVASELGVPVLDADIVGGRSAPEVFLETITLFDLPRTPLAVSNIFGDDALLLRSASPRQEEKFLRDFALRSNGQAYVVGYPLTAGQLKGSVEHGTVTRAIEAGKILLARNRGELDSFLGIKSIGCGKILRIEDDDKDGFLVRNIEIACDQGALSVFVKNEYLVATMNSRIIVSCPDLIVLLGNDGMPLYNLELNLGQYVEVAAIPARPLWRSPAGRELFSPRLFGFDSDAVLLRD